ncbi:lamin tail domain-containing protein [Patescibacteria group bacterium]|nr:lamin tail domain-containing protein [Patescibacteria group bacterium]
MFFLIFLVLSLLCKPALAQANDIHINRYWPNYPGGDALINIPDNQSYVEVINSGSDNIDLSSYYLTDSTSNNSMHLYGSLAGGNKAIFHFQNYLNHSGDTVNLKNDTISINPPESLSYCTGSCSGTDTTNMLCVYLPPGSSSWQGSANVDICYIASIFPTPTITSLPTATPTVAPSVTPQLTTIPTSAANNTPTPTIPLPSNTPFPDPSLTVDPLPLTLKIGQNYTVNFHLNNAIVGRNYVIKGFGGTNNNGIENQNGTTWLYSNTDLDSYKQFNAASSSFSSSITITVNPSQIPQSINIAFKPIDMSDGQKSYAQTSMQTVTVIAADPTAAPTSAATAIPTPTAAPRLVKRTSAVSILPFIFIFVGGILLCVPFVIAKIKK